MVESDSRKGTLYEGTRFELVPATEPGAPERHYILGILDSVAGEEFGWYADCEAVHSEVLRD